MSCAGWELINNKISRKDLVDQGLYEFPYSGNQIVIIGRNLVVYKKTSAVNKKREKLETLYLESKIKLKQITVRKKKLENF